MPIIPIPVCSLFILNREAPSRPLGGCPLNRPFRGQVMAVLCCFLNFFGERRGKAAFGFVVSITQQEKRATCPVASQSCPAQQRDEREE